MNYIVKNYEYINTQNKANIDTKNIDKRENIYIFIIIIIIKQKNN